MRQLIKLGFIFGFTLSSSAFSNNPVQGIYFGLNGEISHATPNPSLNFTGPNGTNFSGPGQISLGPVGGGFGLSLGTRIEGFRIEGQLLYNINNYGELQVGSCTLVSPTVEGPQGQCPVEIQNQNLGLGFNGSAMGIYGLVNVFYDFLSSDPDKNTFPYIGLGLGGAMIRNTANFESNQYSGTSNPVQFSASSSDTGLAVQGIIGYGYYMDDYATIGIDFRYLSAIRKNSGSSSSSSSSSANGASGQFGIATLNFTGTFALDKPDKSS